MYYLNYKKIMNTRSACLIVLLSLSSLAYSQDVYQCDDEDFYRPSPMSVQGSAAYSVPPELAIISMGLDVLKQTASEALQESANIMAKAIKNIQDLGVLKEEIATSNLSVQEQYDNIWDASTQTYNAKFKGFQVSQTLTITTKLVDQAGAIIDAGVSNGMNRVDSVGFDAKDVTKKTIKDNLIAAAIQDARNKANIALKPLGLVVKSVKDVSIDDYSFITPDASTSYEQFQPQGTILHFIQANTNVYSETQVIRASVTLGYLFGPDS